jgi:uncharacterized membrane protein
MSKRLTMLLTATMGAAAMYYFDPARGRYRRALVRDRFVHSTHKAKHGIGIVGRDMRNRTAGTTAGIRSLFDSRPTDDPVLADRVRAALGRVVTHPASIEVEARDGVITLSGPILADEAPALIACVRAVRGVEAVDDELEVHDEPGRIPGLQGEPRQRAGKRSTFMQENWSPSARAIGGLAGAAATLWGLNRHRRAGTLVSGAGLVLLGRALTNLELRRLLGVGEQSFAVNVQKSIRIQAPVETVYRVWTDFEQMPSFAKHVAHVRPLSGPEGEQDDRWRWTVRTPQGLQFSFDSVVTERDENRRLAWHTEDGAMIRHAGQVTFHDNDDGSTTADVKLVYYPLAGALGHGLARLLGIDPKRQMDDDLLRMKTYLETGKPPHDAAAHQLELEVSSVGRRWNGNGTHAPSEPRHYREASREH